MTNKIFDDIQRMCGERGGEIENVRKTIQKFAGDNSPAANGIGRGLTAQIIGKFGGTEGLRLSPERRMLNAAIEERNRVQRQLSLFGFSDGESLFQAVEAAQIRMEAEEKRKQRLEEIRNMKLKPIVPEIKIENVTIEIHLHEKEDAE